MSLKGFLKLKNVVTVTKIISTDDGMGGYILTSNTINIPACALWQNGASNRWQYDKYAKNSTHTLCIEYGVYNFGVSDPNTTVTEIVNYNNEEYKIVGFPDNVMNMNKIIMQSLERTK
jgi:hypothetical protein